MPDLPLARNGKRNAHSFRWIRVGAIFFLIHASLIAHHTYFSASKCDTVNAPLQPGVFGAIPLGRWNNAFGLNRWDALIYETIATRGYPPPNSNGEASYLLNWFPGYPLLARAVSNAMRLPVPPVLALISALSTLGFWLLLWAPPMRRILGVKVLTIASILVLIWPGAFFWFAGMTEPLVAVMSLAVIVAWVSDRYTAALVLCGIATSIKQVFAPIGLVLVLNRTLRERPGPIKILLWLALSCSGLIAYSLFCWIHSADPLAFIYSAQPIYGKSAALRALVDIPHFVRHAQTLNGGSAALTYGFAIVTAAVWIVNQRGTGWVRKLVRGEVPLPVFLWTVGMACTALYISYDAYGIHSFQSIHRYQTANIAHFLLAAYILRPASARTLCLLLLPMAALGLYWQNELTVRYWAWWWVA